MSHLRFRECEGCGLPTGLVEHKPRRLCDVCEIMALWAEPGDEVAHTTTGHMGVVAAEPSDTIEVLRGGRLESWLVTEARRVVANGLPEPITPERRQS